MRARLSEATRHDLRACASCLFPPIPPLEGKMANNSLIDSLSDRIFSSVSFTIIEDGTLQGPDVAEVRVLP